MGKWSTYRKRGGRGTPLQDIFVLEAPRLDQFFLTDEGDQTWRLVAPTDPGLPATQCLYEVLVNDVPADSGPIDFNLDVSAGANSGDVVKGRVRYADIDGNPVSAWSLFNVVVLA